MPTIKPFRNRAHAGKQLALALREYGVDPGAIVLALPRGGVPVGLAVAQALGLPLDILLVRKLGMPGQEEFAIGAVASNGVRVLQRGILQQAGISPAMLDAMCARELAEVARRERRYRGNRPPPHLAGRAVILVDDGLATGSTMRAAIAVAQGQSPASTVVAVPVGAADTCDALAPEVDKLICLVRPQPFRAVSQWYRQFDQTTDDEVIDLLAQSWREQEARERCPSSTNNKFKTGGNDETSDLAGPATR
jgi:putative phosphoribosyl transferase